MQYITHLFAQAYGACSYGSTTYQTTGSSCGSSSGSTGTTGSGSILTNTGFDVLLVVSLACATIFVALVVRFWKRPKRQNLRNDSSPDHSTKQDAAVGRIDQPDENKTGNKERQ